MLKMESNLKVLSLLSAGPVNNKLLSEALREYCRMKCYQDLLPVTWETLEGCEGAEDTLDHLCSALSALKTNWEQLLTGTPGVPLITQEQRASLLRILHVSLSISHPPTLSTALLSVCDHSLKMWKQRCNGDVSMDTDEPFQGGGDFWDRFVSLMSVMRGLGCLPFFMDHSVAQVVRGEVKSVVSEQCSREFETPMIEELVESLQESVTNWIAHIYCGQEVKSHWESQIQYLAHKSFAELRISELFDILVEFPDSKPALCDLRVSLTKVDLRSLLISSLKSVFENRLLHPGANTADIITQYISAIKGLRILEPSGVVLEQVCDPVRMYLRTREDTVRCIVASLIDDSSNELADELVVGDPVLVDLDEESDGEGDYDSWEPDPIDADPSKTSKSRQTSDIISLLVNIYGSREMFVSEYRNLLADRLLQTTSYNTAREVRNLELLKLRFGESNLHFCEVMIKDIADSKRINAFISTKLSRGKEQDDTEQSGANPEVSAFILSDVFWPNFREEKLRLPDFVQKHFDKYCEHYKGLKGMRTLDWKPHLGLVEVDLMLEDRELSFTVSPFRASLIHKFEEKGKWTVDALSSVLEAQPSAVRRHLGFWASQGVLKEKPTDTFSVIEHQQKGTAGSQEVEDEEESATVSAEGQREIEFQMYWAYIIGMLKSLGKMKLDKVHSTLRMFAMQGDGSKECSQGELKSFLDRKVKEQQLCVTNGDYHLP